MRNYDSGGARRAAAGIAGGESMETPIYDFVDAYAKSGVSRLHMPGHKGVGPLGAEALDITEVFGADSLYEAEGIIAQSEKNAAQLFGTGRTFYSTEGSSHGIRAMLFLALMRWKGKLGKGFQKTSSLRSSGQVGDMHGCEHAKRAQECVRPVVVAARNAHKAFLTAAALLDFDIVWLWGGKSKEGTLCACPVSERELSETLCALSIPPVAVYVTSPDYLGGTLDLSAFADIAHAHGTLFLVDNAHGAYLHFLPKSVHPMDLGADFCCDSAHKTFPVLTGGAYLHVARQMARENGGGLERDVRQALALFGSTSPSYLILQSLDLANRSLAQGYGERLLACVDELEKLREKLRAHGWQVEETEPLKLTVAAAKGGYSGGELAGLLREGGVECEYADPDFLVFMATPENTKEDFARIASCMEGIALRPAVSRTPPEFLPPHRMLSVREAVFSPHEMVPAREAVGRVAGAVAVHCPPAIPVVVSGEEIGEDTAAALEYYGMSMVNVIK